MSTSLSRQLLQLKATSSVHTEDSLIADGSFDKTTLHQLAKEAFHVLVGDKIRDLAGFWPLLWPQSTLEYIPPSNAPKPSELKDILPLLGPYALLKDVQWILQYLVTEKKLHVSEPETFFVALLPFYEYEIFARVVKILPEKSCPSYPNWLRNFKLACTPVSKQGMLRHISNNDGFLKLMTESILAFKPLGAKLAHFYASYVTLALNAMETLREAQLIQVLKVVFAGLKSNEKEFRSCAYVLLSFLLPRVEFTEKVCHRLLKIIGVIAPCREVLSLIMVLYRTQSAKERALKLLLKMEDVVASIFSKDSYEEVDDALSYKSVTCDTYAMCLVTMVKDEDDLLIPTPELEKLLSIICAMLSSDWTPTVEAAKALAAKASLVQIRMKTLQKEEIKRIVKSISKLCKKILSHIRSQFPYESNKFSLKKSSAEADILFMDETNDSPTESQIEAKKILLDEAFVNSTLSKKILTYSEYCKLISSGQVVYNIDLVTKVIGQSPQNFLLKQMEPLELLNFTVNTMRLYPKNDDIMSHCAHVFIALFESEPHMKLFEKESINIRLLAIPLLFAYLPSIRKPANIIRLKMFPELGTKEPQGNFNREVYTNLMERSCLTSFFDGMKEELYHDPPLIIMGLLSFCRDKSNPVKSVHHILRFLNLIVTSKMTMEDEEKNEVEEWILRSLKDRANGINGQVLDYVFDEILKMGTFPTEEFEKISNEFILFASKSDKKRFKNLFFRVKTFIRSWGNAQNYMYEDILANLFSLPLSSTNGISDIVVVKLLSEFMSLLEKCRHTNKRFISFTSHAFPRVLASLSDPERTSEITDLCFNIMNSVQNGKLRVISKNESFLPLIGFLLNNRSEIEADLANLPLVMKEFKGKSEEHNLIALSKLCVTCDVHIFARLSVFLMNVPEVNLIAHFASEKLMSSPSYDVSHSSHAWSQIFEFFFHKMIAFLSVKDNESSKFFWSLMKSSHKMNDGAYVSTKALEVLENNIVLIEDHVSLFNQFIDLSGCSQVQSDTMMASRMVIDKLNKVDVKCFMDKLLDIWGPSFFTAAAPTRKKLSNEALKEVELNWSKTHFLLECILRRDNLGSQGTVLIKPYFVLLKHALFYDESDSSDSYSQDLILSGVLSIIESLSEAELAKVDSINPELIVHCIRNSRIPTTKSTALLILAKSSACNPDYVLHNSIPIFTFMGNHFVKMDSKHSFDVACQAIEIIVPHIQKVCGSDSEKLRSTTVKIITTFADAADDLPSHRFTTFLHKLLTLLGDKEYLWIFTMQLLSKAVHQKAKKANEVHLKLMDLFESFDILTQLETIIRIAVNTKTNSPQLMTVLALKEVSDQEIARNEFDLLKLKGLTFVNHLLTSRIFGSQLSEAIKNHANKAKKKSSEKQHPHELELLLEVAILNLEEVLRSSKNSKVHKHLVSQSEKILESALNILPNEALVALMKSLLASKTDSVLRKTLEVLNIKLGAANFNEKDVDLLDALLSISFDNGLDYNRQMALMAIRSLSRILGSQYSRQFLDVATKLCNKKYLAELSGQHNLEASTLLCVIEILIAIGPKAVPLLSGFMNWILKLLTQESKEAVVLNSAILATQKVVEAFGGFLNPYYSQLIIATCSLDKNANKHIKNLMLTLSNGVPTQSLINISLNCFNELSDNPPSLENLFEILRENLSNLSKKEALTSCPPLMDFFTLAFCYRLEKYNQDVDAIERSIIETFLTLTLKLPLDDFKPLFYRVLNSPEETCHLSTVFHVVLLVARKLKSLFTFMVEPVISKVIEYLSKRFAKRVVDGIEEKVSVPSLSHEDETTVNFAIEALGVIFTYSKADSVMSSNYEDNVNAILNHYEIEEPSEAMLQKMNVTVSCLANSTEDDSLWKYLHYQVLLNLRSRNARIRETILDLISLFVDSRGDSYMSVLPDAVPFLAETTEDDDKGIERQTKILLKKMEDVFGQSIDHFFEM